ncbi:hypothetical protein COEREDRAFT_8957 [Coemansia reversa NRRL 1564]|uniref:Uncharacterized protein n=1 Tax=Coemansia reversa (strain ATCC 12441 / NRRL 1564) TaxID=763665 RepID=A0A2G5BAG7_COERN|nr:hypothetical protein COEREDRAFT_8957 [Coemansia reversa NRRL 1564]|eukprot:PIA16004.1 hypothetical protein COEREDRAFT_8957 [Coemansia reversa NRRL 1564]
MVICLDSDHFKTEKEDKILKGECQPNHLSHIPTILSTEVRLIGAMAWVEYATHALGFLGIGQRSSLNKQIFVAK